MTTTELVCTYTYTGGTRKSEIATMGKYEKAKVRKHEETTSLTLCFRFFAKNRQIYDRCNATIRHITYVVFSTFLYRSRQILNYKTSADESIRR